MPKQELTREFGFHVNSLSTNPIDALHGAVAVVDMLGAFVSASDDLSGFDRSGINNDSMHGLYLILSGVSHTVKDATDALCDDDQSSLTNVSHPTSRTLTDNEQSIVDSCLAQLTPAIDEATPKETPQPLSAREAMILSARNSGYAIEDVAHAVNLKQRTVEKIIDKLEGRDTNPNTDDETANPDLAATA